MPASSLSFGHPHSSHPPPTANQLQLGADSAVGPAAVAVRSSPDDPPTAASTAADAAGGDGAAPAIPAADGAVAISWRGARSALGSGAFRLAVLALGALAAASALVHQHAADAPAAAGRGAGESAAQLALGAPGAEAWQLGCAALGFLMYKVAILGVGLTPGGPAPPGALSDVVQFEKNERKAS